MNRAQKETALAKLAAAIRGCTACRLHQTRTQAVPGVGDPDADVFFIGEGPGKDEDLKGEPFVGRAGKFLTVMLESIGWSRENVFIANAVKCRPPENRDPKPDETELCWPFLAQQIDIVQPKLIVTLGRHSMARFLPGLKISEAHGQPHYQADGRVYMPLYHPAAALYSPSSKETHLADFAKIPQILQKLSCAHATTSSR